MTSEALGRCTRRIAHEILESGFATENLVLVGIHTRGVPLAQRLADAIRDIAGLEVAVGALNTSSHRDDGPSRDSALPTHIPVDITNKDVVVVDDVLYTGRTIRAAMDALVELGRSGTTSLAVVVDRGHRELPIKPDFVGKNLPTSRDEVVRVRVTEVDGTDGVWLETKVHA